MRKRAKNPPVRNKIKLVRIFPDRRDPGSYDELFYVVEDRGTRLLISPVEWPADYRIRPQELVARDDVFEVGEIS
jgi:hypothetical protein